MRTKRAFIPSPLNGIARLEDRVVLARPGFLASGAAVLTSRALSKSAGEIREAFEDFAQRGQNYGRLNSDLRNAVSRIPFHRRGGLDDSMSVVVSQLRDDISFKAPRPVRFAFRSAMLNLRDSVRFGIDDGSVALR